MAEMFLASNRLVCDAYMVEVPWGNNGLEGKVETEETLGEKNSGCSESTS